MLKCDRVSPSPVESVIVSREQGQSVSISLYLLTKRVYILLIYSLSSVYFSTVRRTFLPVFRIRSKTKTIRSPAQEQMCPIRWSDMALFKHFKSCLNNIFMEKVMKHNTFNRKYCLLRFTGFMHDPSM